MLHIVKRQMHLILGSVFFLTGLVGIVLPILPTTPFMILAAGCFAKSSPRFHQALLNNRWIGQDLQRWERERTMLRITKIRATWVIVIMFSISIAILMGKFWIQGMLVGIAVILLFFLWRVPESKNESQ
ncbi:YbaN family protein [Thiomicrorhabdus lithotrophica]|uniref:Inner membrane protein n=1 Tax=Thiomicrorhabdus lithotrophica TaxID=2949997 RepID=A0ABY8CAH5_9GAMM|nr:YbaN family protein [Thiomicrorhabdus lithotrophica]WEJ62981.1 YbaN family protein [Thiomicrorhabdus lithotrophica]